jgi:4-aminobutyrate aminotransferase-like enzyme
MFAPFCFRRLRAAQAVTTVLQKTPQKRFFGHTSITMSQAQGDQPKPSYSDLQDSDVAHQMHGFGHPAMQKMPRQLVVFESGDGAVLRDIEGKEYLDAMAGITVAHLGHGREDLARVAYEQVC